MFPDSAAWVARCLLIMGCAPFLGADSILLIELIGDLGEAGTLPPKRVSKTTTDRKAAGVRESIEQTT